MNGPDFDGDIGRKKPFGHPTGRTTVTIDPATSQVVATSDAQALPTGIRAYNAFYPLHASSVGGWL